LHDLAYDRIAQQLATVDPAAIAAAVKRGDAPNALARFLDGCWAGNPPHLAAQEAGFDLDDPWHRDSAAALIGIAPLARSANRRRSQRLTGEAARRAATEALARWETGINPHDGAAQMRLYVGSIGKHRIRGPWMSISSAAKLAGRLESTGRIPADPEVLAVEYDLGPEKAADLIRALAQFWERIDGYFVDMADRSRPARESRLEMRAVAEHEARGRKRARYFDALAAVRRLRPEMTEREARLEAALFLAGRKDDIWRPIRPLLPSAFARPEPELDRDRRP
jgi:hypothetical protein